MPARCYRILIADDHAVVRRGVRALLESQPGIEVCGEATTGSETMDRVKREKPDLLLLDLTMPEMSGLDVAALVRREFPSTEVLVLTVHFSEELAQNVLRSGALGYVLKSDTGEDLLAAVDHVRHRQPFFTSKLAIAMAHSYMQKENPIGAPSTLPGSPLTPREIEVVKLLAKGKGNKEVAAALEVSTRTVESHRNHIMRKMNFGSFSELVRYAVRYRLVEP